MMAVAGRSLLCGCPPTPCFFCKPRGSSCEKQLHRVLGLARVRVSKVSPASLGVGELTVLHSRRGGR